MQLKKFFAKHGNNTIRHTNNEKSLIVLSAPSVKNNDYSLKYTAIIDYMINFANLVHGKDEVVILAPADTVPLFKGKVPSNTVIEVDLGDIWIRDFGSVIPSRQVKFQYKPNYIPASDAKDYEHNFSKWLLKNGLKYHTKSNIILDGGNVVDNAAGTRAIVTERILLDNPSLTKMKAKQMLKQLLGVKEVAIIAEAPDDTTGHADGLVMWSMDDKILLIKLDEPTHAQIVKELNSSFPGVQIVEIENDVPNTVWNGFNSAKNCFVNSIVTDNYIYMPTFNDVQDAEMLEIFKSHTNKTVVPIPAENVCEMGGSVRCMSWQVKNPNKTKILQLVKQ